MEWLIIVIKVELVSNTSLNIILFNSDFKKKWGKCMYGVCPNIADCLLIIVGFEQWLGTIKEMQEGLIPNDNWIALLHM